MRTWKNSMRVVILNTFSLIIIFAIFEGIIRLFLPYNTPFQDRHSYNLQHQPSGYVRYFFQPNQILYSIRDGKILYDKIRYRVNRYGYRGEDFPVQKEKGEIRIVILGGSHVFDLYSYDYEQQPGFPRLIQNALRQDGYPVHVINAGLPGHDTRDFPAKVLLDLHRYQPDIIVVSSVWNDTKWISHTSEETLFLAEAPQGCIPSM